LNYYKHFNRRLKNLKLKVVMAERKSDGLLIALVKTPLHVVLICNNQDVEKVKKFLEENNIEYEYWRNGYFLLHKRREE